MEENTTITKEELLEKADELKEKANQMQSKVVEGIDQTMIQTAEKLDMTADKLHTTAEFLKNKNVNYYQNKLENTAKKHPLKSVLGVFAAGFIIGKLILK